MAGTGDFVVLVVDDAVAVRARVSVLLAQSLGDVVITQASSLRDARRALAMASPDVVIVDLQLGDESGVDLLRDLERLQPRPLAIVLTNHTGEPYRRASAGAGADVFLDKSTEFERLPIAVAPGRRG